MVAMKTQNLQSKAMLLLWEAGGGHGHGKCQWRNTTNQVCTMDSQNAITV